MTALAAARAVSRKKIVGIEALPGVKEDGNTRDDYIARYRGSDVLPTIREQKYLLHHRSHCRYRRRPQSAPPVLARF